MPRVSRTVPLILAASVSVENGWVYEIRKEKQLEVNLELSDIIKVSRGFHKEAFVEEGSIVFPII